MLKGVDLESPDSNGMIAKGPECPQVTPCGYLEVYFGSDAANALVDSGSSLSFCDASLKDEFVKMGFSVHDKKIRIRVADGRWICCPGYVLAKFRIRRRIFQYPLILMPDALQTIILGTDWMVFSGFCPDFQGSRWCWKSRQTQWYPLRRDPNLPLFSLGISPIIDVFTATEEEIREKVDEIKILTVEQKAELLEVLLELRWVFSTKVGVIEAEMELELIDPATPPIAIKPYHLSRFKEIQIEQHVANMAEQNVIVKGHSPWCAPVFIVPKHGGSTRMVIAYCRLNDVLVSDRFPTPNLTDLVSRALKPHFKTSFDCTTAYWHMRMSEKSAPIASFVTHRDQWIPKRCMFGLKTAPAQFCRAVTEIIEPVRHLDIQSYFDDVSLFHEDWPKHLLAIRKGLETLGTAGLRFNLGKTKFCEKELLVLGYLVTDEGILPNPAKYKILKDWPIPNSIKQLRKFTGLANWFRRFLVNFSEKMAPLYEVLKGKDPKFFWGPRQDEAFARIKSELVTTPVLAPPDLSKPWLIYTDASGTGIGAILAQHGDDGKLKTVDMVSRRLSSAERRYVTAEREMLAIVFALKQWRHLIEGCDITVFTDHKPLCLLKKLKDPTGRIAKWLVDLSMLGARLVFNPGRLNTGPDALSRRFEDDCASAKVNPILTPIPSKDPEKELYLFNNDCFAAAVEIEQITLGKIATELINDPFTNALLRSLKGEKLTGLSPAILRFVKLYQSRSVLDDEQRLIYVNVAKDTLDRTDYKILVPKALQRNIIELAHSLPSGGHMGVRRTLKMIFNIYTWPRASRQVTQFVRQCLLCQKHKANNKRADGLVRMAPLDFPWRSISIDLIGPMPRSARQARFALVIVDLFSGWLEVFPIRTANEKTIATILVNELFSRYGSPNCIRSDNGSVFLSKVVREIYRKFRIKPSVTPVYSPKGNYVERANKELKRMIATFIDGNHKDWDLHIKQFCLAQNAAPSSGIGCSPASLFLGREINLPAYPVISQVHEQKLPIYAANLVSRLRRAIEKARANREAFAQARSDKINAKRTGFEFNVGDKVWVKTHFKSNEAGFFSAKLAPRFEGPFEVVQKISPLVYRLKDLSTGIVQKTFQHMDHLRKYIEGEYSTTPPL